MFLIFLSILKHQLTRRTLDQQYKEVKRETNLSHVQRYGDTNMGKLHVGEFQGSRNKDSPENNEPPMKRRDLIEDTMKLVVKVMNNEKKPIAKATIDQTLDCTESVYEQFKSKCFTLQQAPEVGGHLSTLYNYCAEGYTAETINEAIIKICN
ncbi:unnamed protein product [Schistosoma curassoni]|uniref:Legumain prodomain domain-containing protein n=1 Tax=Schistosoma curassoni TaxID=6186 RepID=A0A183JEQ7_9TREM|nr:unnamed protein product [Schistosoma curassoni]